MARADAHPPWPRGFQGYSPEELALTAELTRHEDPLWRWVLPVTRTTRDYIIEQLPALYAAYAIAIGVILAAAIIEGSASPSLITAWLVEAAMSIAARIAIHRHMISVSPVAVASLPALRLLPLVAILLAAVHWAWTATLFIGPTLTPTTVMVLLTYSMLSVASIGIAPASPAICIAYIVPMWSATAFQLFHAEWTTAAVLLVTAAALTGVLWAAYYVVMSGVQRYLLRSDELDLLMGQLRQRNDEVESLRAAAANDLAARTAIFSSASHDLRQRVHALKLLAQFADTPSPARLTGAVEDLEIYMTELLQFVRFDASYRPRLTEVALQELFQRVELTFEDVAHARAVNLRVRATSLSLRTDCAPLVRILENLVSNAVKFTRGGVLVAARQRGQLLCIEVWDQGGGLDARRFGQPPPTTAAVAVPAGGVGPEGFGLGLTIVKRLADALGYRIEVRSWPDRGSCVRVIIPGQAVVKENTL